MDVYLMQHGAALSAEEDPLRPLSPSGRQDVERVAKRAAACGIRAGLCLHSGKLRAEQTADILAEAFRASVEAHEGLNPSDPVLPIADWLTRQAQAKAEGSIVVVGHLPFLDRLVGVLIAGREAAHPIRLRNAGLVKLVLNLEGSAFALEWILTPDLAV